MKPITLEAYFMGRNVSHAHELTVAMLENAGVVLDRYNRLAAMYEADTGKPAPRKVNSGWRPQSINDATPGAAKGSKHLTCEAIDVEDQGPFDQWCMENPERLAEVGLWQEHPGWTDGWCHLQIVPPKSGEHIRTFIPRQGPPVVSKYGSSPVIWRPA